MMGANSSHLDTCPRLQHACISHIVGRGGHLVEALMKHARSCDSKKSNPPTQQPRSKCDHVVRARRPISYVFGVADEEA